MSKAVNLHRDFTSKTATPGIIAKDGISFGLVVSLVANVAMGGCLAWQLWQGESKPQKNAPTAQAPILASRAQAAPPSPAPPFSWSQLDSPDFPTFIERLRKIDCPEPTIHDIIKGELDDIYADKRQDLLVKRGVSDQRFLSTPVKSEVDRLAAEEDQTLASLLAPPGTAIATTAPA